MVGAAVGKKKNRIESSKDFQIDPETLQHLSVQSTVFCQNSVVVFFFTQVTKRYLNPDSEYFYPLWYCKILVCMLSVVADNVQQIAHWRARNCVNNLTE